MKHMLHIKAALFSLAGLLFSSGAALAQTHKADGAITTDEYGPANSYQYSTSDGKWFMTWDDTNLYVAVSDSRFNSPTVLYLDLDPLDIVNGGTNSAGSTQGFDNYDGTSGTLPFRGDAVIFFKPGYYEYRIANGSNSWGPQSTSGLSTGFGGGNVREVVIPWTSLGLSGKPADFNWLGYAVDAPRLNDQGNYVPHQVTTPAPVENYTGTESRTIPFVRYFTVPNTNEFGSAFTRDSFTQIGNSSNFGAINVYDFTLNSPGATITRDNNSGDWNIGGSLQVQNGSLNFGPSNNIISVGQDFTVSSTASVIGGGSAELVVNGDFMVRGSGNFTAPNIISLGARGTLLQVPDNSLSFNNLRLNGGRRTLSNNLIIATSLSLNNAVLVTGSSTDTEAANNITLGSSTSAATLSEQNGGYILGSVSASNNLGTSSAYNFGGIGLTLINSTSGNPAGLVTVRRLTGNVVRSYGAAQSISRQYQVSVTPAMNDMNLSVGLRFNYYDGTNNGSVNELNINNESNLHLYRGTQPEGFYYQVVNSASQPTSRPNADGNVVATTVNLTTLAGYYTLSDGPVNQPLPVELASFTGQYQNNSVLLNWATASEKNNKGFGVERRVGEGSNWQQVAFVVGKSANGATYQQVDATAPQGTVYYRLRQEDNDGTTAYSPVVAVVVAGQTGGATLALSPVPTADVLTISNFGDGQHVAEVYDLRGRRVLSQTISNAQATLQVSALPSGVYLVRVQGGGSAQKGKFVKL